MSSTVFWLLLLASLLATSGGGAALAADVGGGDAVVPMTTSRGPLADFDGHSARSLLVVGGRNDPEVPLSCTCMTRSGYHGQPHRCAVAAHMQSSV